MAKVELPSGLQMMLKAFGIKPEVIMENINQIGEQIDLVAKTLLAIEHRLTAIEAKIGNTVTPNLLS